MLQNKEASGCCLGRVNQVLGSRSGAARLLVKTTQNIVFQEVFETAHKKTSL
jgi:hypothetical protein